MDCQRCTDGSLLLRGERRDRTFLRERTNTMRPNQIILRRLFGIVVLSAAALFEVDALAQTDQDFVNIWCWSLSAR